MPTAISPTKTYTKTFLCLANSRKPRGHCVAGRTFNTKNYTDWLRPISTRPSHEISDGEQQYADGTNTKLLDLVTVTLSQHQPLWHQTENHVIAPVRWQKVGHAGWGNVTAATETVAAPLWHDGDDSFHGKNDKVTEELCKLMNTSLMLIEPERLTIVVAEESRWAGGYDRRVRADFTLNGTPYKFVVTDPWIEKKYFALPDGRYEIPTSRLCLSLPEVHNGIATKLVAAVITPENVTERGADDD
ncbi:MAG TPA: hypothetical protein VH206_16205 [Xanthobacteraceae bacterium]|jgi:hypothetical protein|nr:hypothetical protein [Xanthobacteraceae bacterium]